MTADRLLFKTPQIVTIATISAAFAIVAIFGQAATDLSRAVFGFYGAMVFGGLFQVPGILAHTLLRKRWTALTTQVLFGVVQILLGSVAGFIVLWFTLSEGIFQELFFRAVPLRRADQTLVIAGAGIASWVGAQIPNYFLFGFQQMSVWAWLLPIVVVGIPSSVLFPVAIVTGVKRALTYGMVARLSA